MGAMLGLKYLISRYGAQIIILNCFLTQISSLSLSKWVFRYESTVAKWHARKMIERNLRLGSRFLRKNTKLCGSSAIL